MPPQSPGCLPRSDVATWVFTRTELINSKSVTLADYNWISEVSHHTKKFINVRRLYMFIFSNI